MLVTLRSELDQADLSLVGIVTDQGQIMFPNGINMVLQEVPKGEYYISIHHRNHLGIMSAEKVLVNADN